MAEQIRKIIFTTKEAYDKKVTEGSLDPSAIYAIDASQVVTTTEVKKTIVNSLDKFGLEIGINKEGAEFYHTPLDLAGMIKEVVKSKFDVPYKGAEHINVGNGTKSLSISHVSNSNTYITAIQDGREHGFVPFNIENRVAKVTVPDTVDPTREFELKLSNVFNTLHDTVKVITSSENIVINKLNEFASTINTDRGIRISETDTGLYGVNLYNDNAVYIDNVSKKNIHHFVGHQYRAVIADKSITFNNDDIDAMKSEYRNFDGRFYLLIVDKTFTSYVDLGTGEWKDFPASVSATTTKLGHYFNDYALIIDTLRQNKVDTTMSSIDLASVDTTTAYEIGSLGDFDDANRNKIINAEYLSFDFSGSLQVMNKLVELNATNPLKVKVILFKRGGVTKEIFDKLNELPTLRAIFSSTPYEDFPTIDKRVAYISTDNMNKEMWISIKPGDGKSIPLSNTDSDTVNTIIDGIKAATKPPEDDIDHL